MRNALAPSGVVVVVAAALAVSGCGNSSDVATTSTAAAKRPARQLTPAEYARAANRICREGDRKMYAFIPLGTDPATRRANRAGVIATLREQNERTRALGYPAGAPHRPFDGLYRDFDAALDKAAADDRVDIEKVLQAALAPYLKDVQKYAPDC